MEHARNILSQCNLPVCSSNVSLDFWWSAGCRHLEGSFMEHHRSIRANCSLWCRLFPLGCTGFHPTCWYTKLVRDSAFNCGSDNHCPWVCELCNSNRSSNIEAKYHLTLQRPFGLHYGIRYAFIELSTPFVNLHWFLNKLDKAGSKLQIANGLVLIVVFASCRLIFGSYIGLHFFKDVWTGLHDDGTSYTTIWPSPDRAPLILRHEVVWWVGITFLATHSAVMLLSLFWFQRMIRMVNKHITSVRLATK